MANSTKLIVFLALNLAALCLVVGASARGGDAGRDQQGLQGKDKQLKADASGSSSGSQPDIWLGFIEWPGMAQFKPFLVPLQQSMGQVTQPLSAQILARVPIASQLYENYSNMGSQLTNAMNPAQMMGDSSSGGGSGFSLGQLLPSGR